MKLSKITESTFKYDDAEFTIEKLLNGPMSKIKSAGMDMTVRFEGEDNSPVREVKTHLEAEQFLTFDASVKGWKNVNSADGKKLECDAAGRKTFYENLPADTWADFYKKLTEERSKLYDAAEKQSEKAVKN